MTNKPQHRTEFIGYLHSFRGFAIIMIVMIHAVGAAFYGAYDTYDESHPIIIINEVLFHDSTLYFALISGLLYTKILASRGLLNFYRSKLKFILLPYLFFTLVFTAFKIESDEGLWILSYFYEVFINLIYGKASFVLWYIPVLFFLYAVTPVLDYLLKTNTITRFIFLLVILLPLVVSRIQMAQDYILEFETMLYFTGAYALGMFIGTYLDETMHWVKQNRLLLWTCTLMTSALLFYIYMAQIDLLGFISLKESLFYIQKLGLAVLVIFGFKQLNEKHPKWLNGIANDSFSIYFMHGFLVYALLPLLRPLLKWDETKPLMVMLGSFVLLIGAIVISWMVVKLFQHVFGKYSRMIVGG
ncbi:acyltransferase family protein [Geojedonia litorea]|uniref:Acyltransferase family protein n=1 Tax=Geojedonia litorea TaxID=1268269 RepID=A0ABV9N2S8_9FLAO